jgi:dynactin-4
VARPGANKVVEEGQTPPPPPFAVNLPTSSFPISAFAEDWEYEDDEDAIPRDEFAEEDETGGGESGIGGSPKKKRRSAPGIVERRMNRTTIAMEVAIGRDVVGPLRVSLLLLSLLADRMLTSTRCQANMLVTYVYQSDEGSAPPSPTKSPQKGGFKTSSNVKTFSFWTLLPLGTVQPRPLESRRSMAVSSASST